MNVIKSTSSGGPQVEARESFRASALNTLFLFIKLESIIFKTILVCLKYFQNWYTVSFNISHIHIYGNVQVSICLLFCFYSSWGHTHPLIQKHAWKLSADTFKANCVRLFTPHAWYASSSLFKAVLLHSVHNKLLNICRFGQVHTNLRVCL